MASSLQYPSTLALQEAVRRGRDHLLGSPPQVRPARSKAPPPSCLANLHVEELEYLSEDPENPASSPSQSWVPLRLVKSSQSQSSSTLPVVVFIHSTGSDKNSQAQRQAEYAQRGYLAASIDTRYHGARVDPDMPYQQAIVRSWSEATTAFEKESSGDGSGGDIKKNKSSFERPFLLDVVWDLQRLLDYLVTTRGNHDADPHRIGVTGESLGGMLSWLLAATDSRVAAAAPICGVQNFRYAVENDLFHSRVRSIPHVFTQASKDMGKGGEVDGQVVAAVWEKIMPGLITNPPENGFDAPYSLGLIAPRPLLILNGELDQKTPTKGVEIAMENARKAYNKALEEEALVGGGGGGEKESGERLRLFVEPNVGHEFTPRMHREVDLFMDKWLLNK